MMQQALNGMKQQALNGEQGFVLKNAQQILDSVPRGFRFKPRDHELLLGFLKKKIYNEPLPPHRIRDVEFYKFSPDHHTRGENIREAEWYFFTPRDRKYRNGGRPNRAAGDGFWKATGADAAIEFQGSVVGYDKTLVFYRGKPSKAKKTNWIMHEFVLENAPKRKRDSQQDMKLDDWVLVRLYRKYHNSRVEAPKKEDNTDQQVEKEENTIQAAETITHEPEYGNYIPPEPKQFQVDHHYFNYMPPQQSGPMHVFNDECVDSRSGLPMLPETLDHKVQQHQHTMLPQQPMTVYASRSVAPLSSVPYHFQHWEHNVPLNMYQQQEFPGPYPASASNYQQQHQRFLGVFKYQQGQFSDAPNYHPAQLSGVPNYEQQQISGVPNYQPPFPDDPDNLELTEDDLYLLDNKFGLPTL